MRVATGKIRGGQVVLDGESDPSLEGVEDGTHGFHLDDQSQADLLAAMQEIERGEYITHQQLLADLRQSR